MPRWWPGIVVSLAGCVGCHGPTVTVYTPPPRPATPQRSTELPAVVPRSIEPALSTLPTIDPITADAKKLFSANVQTFRGLDSESCQALAAQQSPIGTTLDRESSRPTVTLQTDKRSCENSADPQFRAELLQLAAREARNRDAKEALDRYFQLADAEGRTELLTKGLAAFDQLRELVPRFREAGLPTLDDDELLRQRAKLLSDIEAAESGIQLLNVELLARLGLSVKGDERLWPTGPFEISTEPIDTEAAVQFALENRPDLQLLRRMTLGVTPQTLPTVNEQLRSLHPLAGSDLPSLPTPRGLLARRAMAKVTEQLRMAANAEVELRREQLFALTAEREKQAAAEVRVAAVQMESARRRIALAKSRVENWQKQVEKARSDDKPFDRLPLEIEWYRARGELIQEIMNWHRWQARFRAAQGLLAQ